MTRAGALLLAGLALLVGGDVSRTSRESSAPHAGAATFSVLVFTKTAGFRHDSIDEGVALVTDLGAQHGFAVVATEDAGTFTRAGLAQYRVAIWLNTTGDVLTAAQQTAFSCYVRSGRGYVGVHSAADTEAGWPFYGELLAGGRFLSHPAIQTATVVVEDPAHPSTAHLPAELDFTDEWYNFAANPRPLAHVLMTLDESSYDPGPGAMGDHPIAWTCSGAMALGAGRAWYTNLGHRAETYADPDFAAHLAGGIRWAAGCDALPCSPPLFSDGFEAGSTCAWSG